MVDEYTRSDVDVRIYELGVGVLLVPYCLVRDLRTLAPFSFFANILTGVGKFGLCCCFACPLVPVV